MENSVSDMSLGVVFAFAVPRLHCCVPLKIPPEGRREEQLPSEGGPSEVETGSIRQSGVESPPVLGGSVGTGRGREMDGSSESSSRIPLLPGFQNRMHHFPQSPLQALRALRVPQSLWPGRLAGEAVAEEVV